MIDGVESFREIQEDINCMMVEIKRRKDVVNVKQSKISGMVFAKAILNKIKAQNETSTSQKITNHLQIIGDLLASTTCRRQLLGCCDQLPEGVSRCWGLIPFLEENPVPDRVQLQALVGKKKESNSNI